LEKVEKYFDKDCEVKRTYLKMEGIISVPAMVP